MCMLNNSLMLVQVRDITSEPAWWEAYSLTIPVLTVADMDGSNEVWTLQHLGLPLRYTGGYKNFMVKIESACFI